MKEETKMKISEANRKRHAEKKASKEETKKEAPIKEMKITTKETPKVEVIDKDIRIFKKNFDFKYVVGQIVPSYLMSRLPELEKRGIV